MSNAKRHNDFVSNETKPNEYAQSKRIIIKETMYSNA